MLDCTNNNYVNSKSAFAVFDISRLITEYLPMDIDIIQNLIILCIGTDRSTGDSLGPLVGHKLTSHMPYFNKVHLFGTLDEPVHAKNLADTITNIEINYPKSFILAVDASLGNSDKIGYINVKKGPLKPGLGVNKKLPSIGDISITGVVNIGGMMEYMVLQNTRLSLVMNMADVISKGIYRTLFRIYYNKLKDIKYP